MKKFLLVFAAIFAIATTANAQFKDSGFKIIGEVGAGVNWVEGKFGTVTPGLDITFGANLGPKFFLGAGVGYNASIGVGDGSGSTNHLNVFGHGRIYFAGGNGFILDLKAGYKRIFEGDGGNAFTYFIGPGFMFKDRQALTIGYVGTVYSGGTEHGPAIKYSVEF